MTWKFDGQRIVLARDAKGMTQAELARLIGATQKQLSEWETGAVKPGQDSLVKIINALDTHPKFFFVQSGNNGNHKLTESTEN